MDNAATTFTILSPIGLEAVALVRGRGQNFSHMGGTPAIESVMKDIEPFTERRILEVGCGLGSAADYIRTHGWGQVTSIDADAQNIAYARGRYPDGDYIRCEATDAPKALETGFDLILSLNGFHRLCNPSTALQSLSHIAAGDCLLRIFDFVDRGRYAQKPIYDGQAALFPELLQLENIEALLEQNGWHYHSTRPLHQQFRIWQEEFVQQTIDHKASLLKLFETTGFEPEPAYRHLLSLAREVYEAIAEGRLGGAIITGSAKPRS